MSYNVGDPKIIMDEWFDINHKLFDNLHMLKLVVAPNIAPQKDTSNYIYSSFNSMITAWNRYEISYPKNILLVFDVNTSEAYLSFCKILDYIKKHSDDFKSFGCHYLLITYVTRKFDERYDFSWITLSLPAKQANMAFSRMSLFNDTRPIKFYRFMFNNKINQNKITKSFFLDELFDIKERIFS